MKGNVRPQRPIKVLAAVAAGALIAGAAVIVSVTSASAVNDIGCKGAGGPQPIPGGGVSFVDLNHGWVVGSRSTATPCQGTGVVLATTNGGVSWTSQTLPAVGALSGVAFASATTGWAAGGTFATGAILGTVDGGATWTTQATFTGIGPLKNVAVANSSTAWAVGYQTVAATTNGGGTWATQTVPASVGNLNAAAFASTQLGWAVGDTSCVTFPCPAAVIATADGGATWVAQAAPPSVVNLEGISAVSTTVVWASGEDCSASPCVGVLIETTDGGATWDRRLIPPGMGALHDVVFTDVNHGWAIGDKCSATCSGPGVLLTTNGGTTWTERDLPALPAYSYGSTTSYRGLAFASATAGWAAATPNRSTPGGYTGGGGVAGTNDGGTTWAQEPVPSVTTGLLDLAVNSSSTAWTGGQTCGPFGLTCGTSVLATTNGGGSWGAEPMPAGSVDGPLTGVAFVDSSHGWAVGTCSIPSCTPPILVTSNGGATWSSQTVPAGVAALYDVTFASVTDGWAVGACSGAACAGTILSTTNGGGTWTPQPVPSDVTTVNDVFFLNATTGWALSQNCNAFPCQAGLLSTTNGGATWTETAIAGMGIPEDVVFVNSTNGWLVGQSNGSPGAGLILATTNGGATWSPQATLSGFGVLYGVHFQSTTSGWAVGSSTSGNALVATILRTTDGGATWDPAALPGQLGSTDGGELYAVRFADAFNGWAVGAINDQALILRTVDGGVSWLPSGAVPPTGLNAIAGDREATLTWTPPAAASAITGYVVTTMPGATTTAVSAVVPAATVTGLTDGTAYTFTVAAVTASGTGPASAPSAPVTPVAVAQGSTRLNLPAMSHDAYGGYLTTLYVQNVGTAPAHILTLYSDQSGNSVGLGNTAAGLPVGATWTVRTDNGDALGPGQAGSATVWSDQPLSGFVNEFAPGGSDATSYSAISYPNGTGTTLYAPTIVNGAYGGYTTGIGLINTGGAVANVTLTYRDAGGNVVKTQDLANIAPGAYQGLYSGDLALALPSGFAGTATITSPASSLAAVVNETGPGGQFSSYDAVSAPGTTAFAPAMLNDAYGGYFTGTGIQNTTGGAGTVTVTYYDSTGGVATTTTHAIAANGYIGLYQGTDLTTPGAYTAKITSDVAVAAIVNEVAPSSTTAKQSTAYNAVGAGSGTLSLPLVESAGPDGWSTGEGIMNTGASATTVTVTYFDTSTGAPIGTADTLVLQPNAYWGLYQPSGGLPNGTRASAVITTSAGGEVAVICNESNATSFMSYIGQ